MLTPDPERYGPDPAEWRPEYDAEYVGTTETGMRIYSSPTLGRGEVILLSEDPYDADA